jgi:DNA-binding CsgD family transcriptional regulator
MYANITPGKASRVAGALTSRHFLPLLEAKRRNARLEPVMVRIMKDLGFDSFMYGMSPVTGPLRRDTRGYVWTTLPAEWVRRYAERGYIEIDPRVTDTYRRNLPLVWDAADYRDDPACAAFFRDAACYGVCSGVAISFRDPDHGRILCAFNAAVTPVDSRRRQAVSERLGDLLLFAMSFHDFFMAQVVDREAALPGRVPPLSRRERQCLELAANGMTSLDIGSKLDIKERTANYHFNNLIHKMGVLNRKEAIAVGIARGWVRVRSTSLEAGRRTEEARRRP